MSVDPALGDEHSNDAKIGNGPAGASLHSSRTGTPFSKRRTGHGRKRRSRSRRFCGPTSWKEAAAAGKRHLLDLRDDVRLLLGVRADRAAHRARRKIAQLAMGAAGAFVVAVLMFGATMRLVAGVSQALAVVFDGRTWLADLTTGIVLLSAVAAGGAWVVRRGNRKELEKHIEKYERLHDERRARHDDVSGSSKVLPEPRRAAR